MVDTVRRPGWPGRGGDPTGGFKNLQWYFYHQGAVVYFAAFSRDAYDAAELSRLTRRVLEVAPHLTGLPPDKPVNDAMIQDIVEVRPVADFIAMPDGVLDEVGLPPQTHLPLFRAVAFVREHGPDAEGRRSFLMFCATHALAEGADSSKLARSQTASHEAATQSGHPLGPMDWISGAGFAIGQILVSRLYTPHPDRIGHVSLALDRARLADLAHQMGISQRALFMAFAGRAITGAGTPWGKRRVSIVYPSLGKDGPSDGFLRMRIRYLHVASKRTFAEFASALALAVERNEERPDGYSKAAAIAVHRWLAGRMPWLYSPRLFRYWPYDVVFSLLTPHELTGSLTDGMMEPIYCGANTPGTNGCDVVPGRTVVTFNFHVEVSRIAQIRAAAEEFTALVAAPTAGVRALLAS